MNPVPSSEDSLKHHSKYESKHHSMVRWYNPALLLRMALRSVVAKVVGQIADNREIQAALNPVHNDKLKGAYDFSEIQSGKDLDGVSLDKNFWVDYVADIGDGWNSTFAVASQLALPELEIDGEYEALQRGSLFIMGGDEVYPDPSMQAYQERTLAPYTLAGQNGGMEDGKIKPYLFALPGNHDWYDGLHAFNNIFCQARGRSSDLESCDVATWKTIQKRSYFSIKLPHGWWLCGVDIQLGSGANTTQIDYFREIAKTQMHVGDRIILCCAKPEWLLSEIGETDMMQSFSELMQVLTPSGAEVRLVLAGDVHHYSRYESESDQNKVEFVTAGGGGAFMHPTHKLPEELGKHSATTANANVKTKTKPRLKLKTCYPSKKTSFNESHKLFLFPFSNWDFALLIGAIYTLMAWFFEARTLSTGEPMSAIFMYWLSGKMPAAMGLMDFILTIPKSPEFALIVFLLYFGFIKFNLTQRTFVSVGLGVAHALAHFLPFLIAYFTASWVAIQMTGISGSVLDGLTSFVIFITVMFVLSSLLGGFIFGTYLWVALNVFGLQWTNAFSALRICNYKNFLRLRLDKNGELTVYPLKIDNISQEPNRVELIETPFTIK